MIFPFTFNFSVPGLLNPFLKAPLGHSAPTATGGVGSAGEQGNNKLSRLPQSPTYDSCQSSSSHSQGTSDYRDIVPAPAYPSSPSIPFTHQRRISRAQLPKIERRLSPSPSTSVSSSLRALPLSRKRGWEPAFGSESIQSLSPPGGKGKTDSTTSLTLLSSSGYLDTPAKYRDMASDISMGDEAYEAHIEGEHREADQDAPPLKKRRGLAGSIVSTAVSAALIGTAVGLTVYRLWRDRGKENQAQLTHPASSSSRHIDGASTPGSDTDQQIPPPPYDPGAWKPPIRDDQPVLALTPPTPSSTPRSKNKRAKRPVGHGHGHHHSSSGSGSMRRAGRPRYGAAAGGGVGASPRVRPEFDFGRVGLGIGGLEPEEEGQVEDKMDWIGDKLSMLIEQGRRALQSEVVVMSEAKEDEVDDGRGGWEEEDSEEDRRNVSRSGSVKSRSRAGSVRKSRPKNIVPPSPFRPSFTMTPPHSGSISASPRMSTFPSGSSAYATPSTSYTPALASGGFAPSTSLSTLSSYSVKVAGGHGHMRGLSYESALPSSGSLSTPNTTASFGREEPETWESPELRESMERARARMLARRAGGGPV